MITTKNYFKEIYAILYKEILSEFRTRYSISNIFLFILTTITMIALALVNEKMGAELSSGLLWIVIFFASMIGLSKTFVSEEERGTSFLLQVFASSTSIYFGKLIFNILLSLFINFFALILFFLFSNSKAVSTPDLLTLVIAISSVAIATSTTVISAIVSKANSKNALFPILSFPILLPIIKIGMDLTVSTFIGTSFLAISSDLQLIVAYVGFITTISYLLFDFIWKE
jgi:heme exporter protein B